MKLELRSGEWDVQVDSSGENGLHWVHLVRNDGDSSMHARMGIESVSFREPILQAFEWPDQRRVVVDGTRWKCRRVDDHSDFIEATSSNASVTGVLPDGVALGHATDLELAAIVRSG